MKRIVALSLILLASGQLMNGMGGVAVNNPRVTGVAAGTAITNPRLQLKQPVTNMPTTTPALAAASGAYDYSAAIAKVKANVPVIIASVKVLVPKVQQIVGSASSGGFTGFISSVVQGALDSSTREAVMNLVGKIGETIDQIITLKKAPTSVKQDAKGILSAITKDKDVQQLLSIIKGVPFVGTLLHDKLNELLVDITTL